MLVTAKEEKAIFNDWTTNGEAAFVATRFGPLDSILVEEEIIGVELLVLDIEVCSAIELICSALGDQLEVAAPERPVEAS